jgi:hypothetical protein
LWLLLAIVLPPLCSANSGAIEGTRVDPSLAFATVQDFSVVYDACPISEPECSWDATATLVPPSRASCPSNWSWLLEALESPPGMPPPPPGSPPYLPIKKAWSAESKGNGVLRSGPLHLPLEGVNDYRLCLYAEHFYDKSTYTPHIPDEADLVASQVLHVELPAQPPPATAPGKPTPRKRCRKGKHRVTMGGKKRCRKVKHRSPGRK